MHISTTACKTVYPCLHNLPFPVLSLRLILLALSSSGDQPFPAGPGDSPCSKARSSWAGPGRESKHSRLRSEELYCAARMTLVYQT